MNQEVKKIVRGPYKAGLKRQQEIIQAAVELLISEGYHNFSFRKVAKSAGISVGNLQYHFNSKESLVEAMLDDTIAGYIEDLEDLTQQAKDPKDQLYLILKHVITDLNERFTTNFFPELWSLANHDDYTAKLMEKMYSEYRVYYHKVIKEINPKLSQQQVEKLALFFSASIEGHTVFIGHNKPWQHLTKDIVEMTHASFVFLINSGKIPE